MALKLTSGLNGYYSHVVIKV